jgi:23S rRNA G2069 N7-methylase RlmK/C1962 C5-methylase RlmI
MNFLKKSRVDTALSTSLFSQYGRHLSSSLPLIAEVILKKDKTKLVEDMNPFVYSHAIKTTIPTEIVMGHECLVKDSKGCVLGRGVYNPESLYRVRMLALASEAIENIFDPLSISISELLLYRLKEAKELRHSIIGLPNADTTVYRLVNGEGDRLSGLIIDIFNEDIIVVQSSAAWTEKHRSSIESSLQSLYPNFSSIVWLPMASRLVQEGWLPTNTTTATNTEEDQIESQSEKDFIRVLENGISYKVSPGNGQKTGFYCDQRENRRLMQTFCRGNKTY